MRQALPRRAVWLRFAHFLAVSLAPCLLASVGARAQAPQPYLFAGQQSGTNPPNLITFLRDDVTGVPTLLQNSSSTLRNDCYPSAVDAKGRFLFGPCGNGLSMYALDSSSGKVSELPASPFAVSSGHSNSLVAAEGTGQFVYLLKADLNSSQQIQNLYLDTFQIGAATSALVPLTSQTLPVTGNFVGAVADPNQHGMAIFLNQDQGVPSPAAILYVITFDPITGSATLDPTGGKRIDDNARAIAISPTGNFLGLGSGAGIGNLTMYSISPTNFALTLVGTESFGNELNFVFPNYIVFSPNGQLVYVQAPSSLYTGSGVPILILESATLGQLPTPPISPPDAGFTGYLKDPQGPFSFTNNTGGGLLVFETDPGTGLASQPGALNNVFYPQLAYFPFLAAIGPGGAQNISGPALSETPLFVTFSQTSVGQSNGPQSVMLSSVGDQGVAITSISLTGANAADFHQTNNCLTIPLLAPKQFCTVSVTYSPLGGGTSNAAISIFDNTPGSPHDVLLTGTSAAAPPPAPVVTLNPNTALTFGSPNPVTQGTSSAPQNISLSNSGNAALHVTSIAASGINAGDFVIGTPNCPATVAAAANCVIPVVFSPLAAGLRTANLTITDDAANSPQSISLSGNAIPAATIVPAANGGATASVSAGLTAQYNLLAMPGAGFAGTLSFACAGVPQGAACSAPSVNVASGAATPFSVMISTSGAGSAFLPRVPTGRTPFDVARLFAQIVLVLVIFVLWGHRRTQMGFYVRRCAALCVCLLLAYFLSACGGAGATSAARPQQIVTPVGSYIITVTPTATATGSSKALQLDLVTLTLVVK